jgi:predicted transcriptional regulator
LLGRYFESSPSALVAHLLENKQISDAELERIRKLIRKKRTSRQ